MLFELMSCPIIVPRKSLCYIPTIMNAAEESLLSTIAMTVIVVTVKVSLSVKTF